MPARTERDRLDGFARAIRNRIAMRREVTVGLGPDFPGPALGS